MKYFVQGAIATGLLVLGLAVLVGAYSPDGSYAVLGTVLEKPTPANPALLGVLLVVSALAFKIAASPFSAWAPDAYQSARSEVASALSSAPKLGAIGALALFVVVASTGALARQLLVPLALLSVLSVVVGSVGALRQRSYTRMLGYASVAQTGYALIGVAVLSPTAAVFFAATYALATTGTFMAATAFRRMRPDWDGTIDGLGGLGRTAPRTALGLSLLLVSLAGIPPMLGFWGKLQVFGAAVLAAGRAFSVGGDSASGAVYALLAVVGVVGSVISLAYYGSVLRALYFEREAGEACDPSESESGAAGWAVFGLGVLLLVLGLMPIVFGVATVLRPFVVR
jgi:NADH-quinone oxidoreductase subunit N